MNKGKYIQYIILFLLQAYLINNQLYAQSSAILIQENFTNTDLESALLQLEQNYPIQLAYESEIVKDIQINQVLQELPLAEALELLLQSTGLSFLILGEDKVLIRPEPTSYNYSENAITYNGKITDKEEGSPLPYALLFLEKDKGGAYTNDEGLFELSVPEKDLPLQLNIQHLGFEPLQLTLTRNTKTNLGSIQMEYQQVSISPITVSELPPALSSLNKGDGTRISVEELNKLPGFIGGNDLMRQLQLLPGVSAHNDRSAGLQVRAGGNDENLIILDGITLYEVDHFFGVFSALNTEAIAEAQLYKNAFPAEYGGRTASILEVTGKSGLDRPFNGSLSINSLLGNAFLSIPVGPKMSFMLSGRLSNRNVAKTQLFGLISEDEIISQRFPNISDAAESSIQNIQPDFRFYDTHMNWHWQASDKSLFKASLFMSEDNFGYDYEQSYRRLFNNLPRLITERYEEDASWQNQGWNLAYQRNWNQQLSSALEYSYSQLNTSRNTVASVDRGIGPNTPITTFDNSQTNEIKSHFIDWKNNWQISPQSQLKLGYHYNYNLVNHNIDLARKPSLTKADKASLHAIYGEHLHDWENGLHTTFGLRASYYGLSKEVLLSPRLFLSYQIVDHWLLKASLSRYHQFLRNFVYEDRFGRNFDFWVLSDDQQFPVAHANQAMFGSKWINKTGWTIDLELYAKKMEGIRIYALVLPAIRTDQQAQPNNYRLFSGTGKTIGIDLLIKKDWKAYSSWLAYTLSKSTHQFPGINQGLAFPAENDRRHQLKWANMYRWKKFDFSATYIFTSGKPYLDYSQFDPEENRGEININDYYTYLQDYHRVDVGLNFHFDYLPGKVATLEASVFNLFNHSNIAYRQFIFSLPSQNEQGLPNNVVLGNDLQLLDRTYNIGISLKF